MVWLKAYTLTQHVSEGSGALLSKEGGCTRLEALIRRPFGQDAVGWQLAVYMEDASRLTKPSRQVFNFVHEPALQQPFLLQRSF